MLEVVIGAAAGAVVGWPSLWWSARNARRVEDRARELQRENDRQTWERDSVLLCWTAAHDADHAILAHVRAHGGSLTPEFYATVDPLAQTLWREHKVLPDTIAEPLRNAMQVVNLADPGIPQYRSAPDDQRVRHAVDAVTFVQHLCSAFLTGRPLPDEPDGFAGYRSAAFADRFLEPRSGSTDSP
ncbi:hypothetical protein [Yinghuangia sp. YIM S09857]|uniref:hypothetical protein n=1 Tax=Yinghuangia sp. YIM S09857 TaxID=3436929 RepID=UPI003F537977